MVAGLHDLEKPWDAIIRESSFSSCSNRLSLFWEDKVVHPLTKWKHNPVEGLRKLEGHAGVLSTAHRLSAAKGGKGGSADDAWRPTNEQMPNKKPWKPAPAAKAAPKGKTKGGKGGSADARKDCWTCHK